MKTHPTETLNPQPDHRDPAATSSRRALTRKGAKLAFVLPAAVALKVNVASAGELPPAVGTGIQNP